MAAHARRPQVLAVDLRALTFIDMVGMRLMADCGARADQGGYQLAICLCPEVRRVFEVTAADDWLWPEARCAHDRPGDDIALPVAGRFDGGLDARR